MHFAIKTSVLAVLTFLVAAESVSYSSIGDIQIYSDNGKVQCDKLICPDGTVRCEVIQEVATYSEGNVTRKTICYGKNNDILDKSEVQLTPTPQNNFNAHIINDLHSGFSYSTIGDKKLSDVDAEKFANDLQANIQQNANDLQANIQQNVQNILQDVQENLRRSLGRWFK